MLQHLIPLYQALLITFLLLQTACGNEEMADNQAKDTDASASIKNTLPPVPKAEELIVAIDEPLLVPVPANPIPLPYPILRGGGGHGRPKPVCGNSRLEKDEECDDGNIVGGDGCSSVCKLEFCGNAIVDVGEQCDPQSPEITCDENEACESCQCVSLISYSDLSIYKIGNRLEIGRGQALTYTLTVTNNGPDAAVNVVVTDTLPSATTFVSAAGCSHASGIVTCNITSLANGASQNFEINVSVNQNASGTIDNSAVVTSDSVDQDMDNNSDLYTAYVVTTTDVQLTKTVSNSQPIPGATITYTLTAANLGDVIESINLSIEDILPAGVTFISANSSSFTCDETVGTITCTLASLAPSATANITINVTVDAMSGAEITNTANLFADNEADGSNNSSSATINVTAPAPILKISKSAGFFGPPNVGVDAFYNIQLQNTGTATATGIVITDTLPSSFMFQSFGSGNPNNCTHSNGVVTCNIASLAPNTSSIPTLIGGVFTSAGEALNNVTVDDDDAGSDPNDSFGLITTVMPTPTFSE